MPSFSIVFDGLAFGPSALWECQPRAGFCPGALWPPWGGKGSRRRQLCQGSGCSTTQIVGAKLCDTLLGRDRPAAAVVNDDIHTWLGHAVRKSTELDTCTFTTSLDQQETMGNKHSQHNQAEVPNDLCERVVS